MLPDDVDRIDAIMIMHRKTNFRVSRSITKKKQLAPARATAKTGIFCGPHLIGDGHVDAKIAAFEGFWRYKLMAGATSLANKRASSSRSCGPP